MLRISQLVLDVLRMCLTARIDIKNKGEGCDLDIKLSDVEARIEKPDWFSEGGHGYVISSKALELSIEATCEKDGEFHLILRGSDVRDAESGAQIPAWVDYQSLEVNGEEILETSVPVWHNIPYTYKRQVKNGEKISLKISWCPHISNWQELEHEVECLGKNRLHELYCEQMALTIQGKPIAESRKNYKTPMHISVMGVCISRDMVGMLGDKVIVDRFIQDISPISLGYSGLLGGGRCLTMESIEDYLKDPSSNKFTIRNTLLDVNKTAYDYLFEVHSDYLILDLGSLRYRTMIDLKEGRAMTETLLDRLRWSDSSGTWKPFFTMDVEDDEFYRCMDGMVDRILKHYDQKQIILVDVYQVDYYLEKSSRYIRHFGWSNLPSNRGVARGYVYLRSKLPQAHVIPFPNNVIGDANQLWGLGNLHYVPEYYEYGKKCLTTIFTGLSYQEERKEIEKLRRMCEKKINWGYMGASAISGRW